MKRTLFALVVCICLGGCSSEDENSTLNSAFLGTWEITSIQVSSASLTQRPPTGEVISISFLADGAFNGSTPNNTFNGLYGFEGTNTLMITEYSATDAEDTTYGQAFFNALDEAAVPELESTLFGYSFESQDLILVFGDSGEMVLEK